MPETLAVSPKPSESLALQWLALALTPRLGPTRARRLVEHFGGVQNVFKASLTELEATGIQTVSAQSLGTGQSMERIQTDSDRDFYLTADEALAYGVIDRVVGHSETGASRINGTSPNGARAH